jgi:hypothetical protein
MKSTVAILWDVRMEALLCGECWQKRHEDDYLPTSGTDDGGADYGECDLCGMDAILYGDSLTCTLSSESTYLIQTAPRFAYGRDYVGRITSIDAHGDAFVELENNRGTEYVSLNVRTRIYRVQDYGRWTISNGML